MRLGLTTLLLALMLLAGCAAPGRGAAPAAPAAPGATAASAAPVRLVASTTLLADLAAHVAGARAQVSSLAPAGADVEDYQTRPDDAQRVAAADVLVVNGLGLDRWAERLIQSAARPSAVRVTLSDGLDVIRGAGAGDTANPHLWLDVRLAKRYTETLRDALIRADPAGADTYRANQAAYSRQLDDLDAWVRAQVATLPPERRKLVTFHDAFPYFARAYGFEVIGFVAPDPAHEPSARELADLVARVKATKAPAVFGEAQFSPKLVEALGRETGVKVVTDLYNDSLGPPPADSYAGLMRYDVGRIVEALKG